MNRIRTAAAAIVLSTSAVLSGCPAARAPIGGPAADPSILRVSVSPNAEPIVFERGGQIVGLEADLAAALGARLGREVVFVEIEWADAIDAVEHDRVDIIMSGMSVTPMRELRIAFAEPYLTVGQAVLRRSTDGLRFPTLGTLRLGPTRIGVERGSTGHIFVEQDMSPAIAVPYDSAEETVAAMLEGEVDVAMHDAPVIWLLASKHETDGVVLLQGLLTRENLAWGVSREDPVFLGQVNTALAAMRASGELSQIIERWLPYATDDP